MTDSSQAVFMLGVHRSGTSALSRLLNLMGVELGNDLLPPAADNELGFWEHRQISVIHDRILEALGREWWAVTPFPSQWWLGPQMEALGRQLLDAVRRDFAHSRLWGLKDPRLCFTLPLWRHLFNHEAAFKCVLIVRNPAEVARSLGKRDAMSPARAYGLWLRSMIEAERASRGLARMLISYPALLDNWQMQVQRIGSALDIPWPNTIASAAPAVAEFIRPSLRHHAIADEGFLNDNNVPEEIRQAYAAALQAVTSGDFAPLAATLDGLDEELSQSPALFRRYLGELEQAHRSAMGTSALELMKLRDDLTTARNESAAQAASQASQLAQAAQQFAAEQQQQAATAAQLHDVQAQLADLQALHAVTQAAHDSLQAAHDSLTAELHLAQQQAAKMTADHAKRQADFSAKEAEFARTRKQASGKIEQLAAELAAASDETNRTIAHLTELTRQRADERSHVEQLEGQMRAIRDELREAYQVRDALGQRLRTLFQSWTWRITKPARILTRWLGAGRVGLGQLAPVAGGQRNSAGQWEGVGLPHFVIPVAPLRGWVRLRATVKTSVASRACLYFDTGSGFNEAERADLGAVAGHTVIDRIISLRSTTYLARFDPLRHYGSFSLSDFSWQPISRFAALASILRENLRRWVAAGHQPRPSLRRGLQLLFSGKAGTFYRQLLANAQNHGELSAYDAWLRQHQITDAFRAQMKREIASWKNPPLLAVILPVYDVPEIYLRKCIDSVLRQTYSHWELCIADDASPSPHVKPVLQEYAARDPRIKVTFRPTNGNISATSNAALALATAPYIALLDHDDEIAEHALFRMAQAIVADPALDMIYSDEDKMTADGRRLDPFFKPDWSPDYFLFCMYTCHLGVYRTELIRQMGGWRSAFDGAQDYDLVLRLLLTQPKIHHIPDVLYHWRVLETSTASGPSAKPTAHLRAHAAIEQYLLASQRPAMVQDGPAAGFHVVRYDIIGKPRISIIIPSACQPVELDGAVTYRALHCVKSIRNSSYDNVEIIVLHRGDMPADLQKPLAALETRCVSYDFAFNWSAVNNHGAAAATGEYLLFLNDDTEVITPDWLEQMLGYAQWPEIGAVGAKLLFADGTLQHTGVCLPGGNPTHPFYGYPQAHPGYYFSNEATRNWLAVSGACLLTRAQVFHAVGQFDESLPLNYNDVEFCLRLQDAGYRVVYVPGARLYHLESKTRQSVIRPEESVMMHQLWDEKYRWDPYYNPNLATDSSDFRINPMAPAVAHLTSRTKPPAIVATLHPATVNAD